MFSSEELMNNEDMAKPNLIREKAYTFSLKIVMFCRRTQKEQKEYILTKQLFRSGTSISANIEEAQQARTRKEFGSSCSISLREAYESRIWLRLMRDSNLARTKECNLLLQELHEIICLLVAILKTTNAAPEKSHSS
jgi:four helix bundle protein